MPILIFGGAFLIGAGVGGYYAYQQGYGFESWQLYAYAGMGGLAGVVGAATGMWIEAALLPVGATAGQAFLAGAAGGFAAGVVEQSILEAGGAYILGTEVSAERILLAGGVGGVTGGLSGMASRWLRLRARKRVVIGEGMESVKKAAREHNARWYQAWRKYFEPENFVLEESLARNERWIRQKIAVGYEILDIGIDPSRARRSPFYALEKRILEEMNYPTTPIGRP